MRSIWKGAISFGLVTIPIKVVGATENHRVSFHQVHTADGGRIRYRKVCELDGAEVSGDQITKGYQAPDGTVVQVSDDELAQLPLPTARTVEILGFVPVSSIDPIQWDRSYYLAPDAGADKPYVLLRRAMERGGRGAIAKLAMRGRETLALLRPGEEQVLGMHTLLWPDEIRSPQGIAPQERVTVRDAELDLADRLMDTLGDVDMSELHDDYRDAVERLVSAKLAGTEPEKPAEAPSGGQVIDLMSALEDSVRAARGGRGEEEKGAGDGEREATVTELHGRRGDAKSGTGKKSADATRTGGDAGGGKPAATKKAQAKKKTAAKKKTDGKKTAAKKAAAKKTAAKKTAAKKTASSGSGGKSRGKSA